MHTTYQHVFSYVGMNKSIDSRSLDYFAFRSKAHCFRLDLGLDETVNRRNVTFLREKNLFVVAIVKLQLWEKKWKL